VAKHGAEAVFYAATTALVAAGAVEFASGLLEGLGAAGGEATLAEAGGESGWMTLEEAEAQSVKEGIYEFTSSDGRTYVGQTDNFGRRIGEHLGGPEPKLLQEDLGSVRVRGVQGGKTAREIQEQLRIMDLGGVKCLRNIRNPIGPARQYLMP
jgi:hypothetical protein